MATFTIRKRFSPREIGAIRKKFYEIKVRVETKFEMPVDGSPIKVTYGYETFFRFATPSYVIELSPWNVRHKKNENAVGLCIRSFDPDNKNILDCHIATSVKSPDKVLEDAYNIVEQLESLRIDQHNS